jgi:transcriptional regulator with XRE-family HTH domain
MRIGLQLTDDAVLDELGERLARLRLQRNLTQVQLAEEAGVDRKVVGRLEAGERVQLLALVRVLRALGRLDALDAVVPPAQASPIELLELRGRSRQRARPRSQKPSRPAGEAGEPVDEATEPTDGATEPVDEAREPWHWGDER